MDRSRASQCGTVLLMATLLILVAIGFAFAVALEAPAASSRERATERAIALAREGLLAYAADRAINATVGPGYLPCPDLDNDGWAESTCGSLDGASGQDERIGRLPWKTLGLPDLRDGDGERLWYAVSSKYKGLLNCAASAGCVDMSPEAALGAITVRDSAGTLLHDGTLAEPHRAAEGGAVAVVIAPGAPLMRVEGAGDTGRVQARTCGALDCDERGRCLTDPPRRAAACDPANYLDKAPAPRFAFEDNADFVDRHDAAGRARNTNGFVQGPVVLSDGRVAVNDRVSAIGYRDVMARLMRRVALEVASCLRAQAAGHGAYPWPVPLVAQASSATASWTAVAGAGFGRVADVAWAEGCNLSASGAHSWWKAWRPHVFYRLQPGGLDVSDASGRLVARGRDAAVIVAGPPLAIDGFVQHRDDPAMGDARQWLEGGNALLDGAARVTSMGATRTFNDVAIAIP